MGVLVLKPEKSQANWDESVTITLTQIWPIRANSALSTTGIDSMMETCSRPDQKDSILKLFLKQLRKIQSLSSSSS